MFTKWLQKEWKHLTSKLINVRSVKTLISHNNLVLLRLFHLQNIFPCDNWNNLPVNIKELLTYNKLLHVAEKLLVSWFCYIWRFILLNFVKQNPDFYILMYDGVFGPFLLNKSYILR